MRWIWIDKFVAFEPGRSAVAVKAVTAAEEHLHDLYPGFPVVPHALIVEGMAQTGGILVGEAKGFREKVVLAKLGKAEFHRLVRPGETLRFAAMLDSITDVGASVSGVVTAQGGEGRAGEGGEAFHVADVSLMFSHVDQNMAGMKFPDHNFVFSSGFIELLANFRKSVDVTL